MPSERGSTRLCDEIDEHGVVLEFHGRSVIRLLTLIERVTDDDVIDGSERRELQAECRQHRASYVEAIDALPMIRTHAAEQDDAFMCIGAIAGAGRVSRHAASKVKQAAIDAAQTTETTKARTADTVQAL